MTHMIVGRRTSPPDVSGAGYCSALSMVLGRPRYAVKRCLTITHAFWGQKALNMWELCNYHSE